MNAESPRLAVAATAPDATAAHLIASALREAGLDAVVIDDDAVTLSASTGARRRDVPVLVSEDDLSAARVALEAWRTDRDDVDWDATDVGAREDALPLREPGHMPLIVRAGFVIAIALVVVGLVAAVLVLVL